MLFILLVHSKAFSSFRHSVNVILGLRYYLLGTKQTDMGHILENVVYLELLRRGYEVHVGKVGDAKVDFIAINDDGFCSNGIT